MQTRKQKRHRRRTRKGGHNLNLIVQYGSTQVAGQELSKQETQSQPSVQFTPIPGRLYTLVMWDPDVPQQIQPGFVHWIVTNIQSPKDIPLNILLEYKGPSPPSGTHRYFFGLFEQQSGQIMPNAPPNTKFSIDQFIKDNNLKEVARSFMTVNANV
jgi:phosphatidylethanolamine-binding protein (PEBP) family uncharacterized protein